MIGRFLPLVALLLATPAPSPCSVVAARLASSMPGAARCDCMTPPSPREAQAQAAAVFIGVVDSISPARLPLHGRAETYEGRQVRFRIVAAWPSGRGPRRVAKGSLPPRGVADAAYRPAPQDSVLVVGTGLGGGDCGFAFHQGVTYLVYASGLPGALLTGICQRTRPEAEASSDVAALGQPGVDRRERRAPTIPPR
jgi:hypothetical protein